MANCKFKIGDKVRITGTREDYTDSLDGKIGEVVDVFAKYILVAVDGYINLWAVGNSNAKVIKPPKKEKPEKPKYYSGKVVCVESEFTRDFTVGKVYKFVDGVVKDNRGATRFVGNKIKDPSEIKSVWKFIPFVEDVVEDVEKPLSVEELRNMDGQKVWLVSLDENKKPYSNNRLGGWHTVDVKKDKLIDEKDDFFYIKDSYTTFGFIAYRTAPSK